MEPKSPPIYIYKIFGGIHTQYISKPELNFICNWSAWVNFWDELMKFTCIQNDWAFHTSDAYMSKSMVVSDNG